MMLRGTLILYAPIEEVWCVLLDPTRLCRAVPGCEEARQVDETHYDALLAVKVQFLTIRSQAHGRLVEVEEPHHLAVELVGEPIAMAGAFRARFGVDLAPIDGGTTVDYTVDLSMFGRLASLGEAIIHTTAQRQTEQFAANLAALFEAANRA